MRDAVFTIVMSLMLFVAFVLNVETIKSNEGLLKDLKAFKDQGGRNTNKMGYYLCERTNRLELLNGIAPADCKMIYRM